MGKLSVCVEIGFWLIHHFTSFPFDWLVCRRRRLKQLDGVSFQQEFYNEKGKFNKSLSKSTNNNVKTRTKPRS